MDQGIIRALKAKCHSLAVQKLIAALEKKNPVPTISILSSMTMLEKAWNGGIKRGIKLSLIASRKLVL